MVILIPASPSIIFIHLLTVVFETALKQCFMWFYKGYEQLCFVISQAFCSFQIFLHGSQGSLLLGNAASFSGSGLKPGLLCFIF